MKKRIVLKVGSAVLTEKNRIAKKRMENLVALISKLREEYEIIFVSSGAVAAGYTELKLDKKITANRQALASIGQPLLMYRYKRKFQRHGILVSQVLVTATNFNTPEQVGRVKDTVETLLSNGVIPILNENDATAIEELVVGDNDQLAAYATFHFDAQMLVIFSDINAYYNKDPRTHDDAEVLKVVHTIEQNELEKQVTPNHLFAIGGIVTKLKAANYLLNKNIPMFLASGFDLSDAYAFLLNHEHSGGTLFQPKASV